MSSAIEAQGTEALLALAAPVSPAQRLLHGLEQRLPDAAELLLGAGRLGGMAVEELRSPSPLPRRHRLRAWRRGFLAATWVLADLDHQDERERITDVESVLAARINGPWRRLLNDKLLFAHLMARFPGKAPRTLAVVEGGRFRAGPDPDTARGMDDLAERLAAAGAGVLKPIDSSHGHGVYLLDHDGIEFRLDGRPCSRSLLERRLAVGRLLVQERTRQHPYAAALFPDTTNTLRVITMWDRRAGAPFVAAASQRIGTRASFPVDNVSKGGLWRPLSIPGGSFGPACGYDRRAGRLTRHATHPDTGAPLADGAVPGFPAIVTSLLEIAGALPMLPFVGWDLVVTAEGFHIIEGNNSPELSGMGPLLHDERIRRFLAERGVLLPWRRREPPAARRRRAG